MIIEMDKFLNKIEQEKENKEQKKEKKTAEKKKKGDKPKEKDPKWYIQTGL